jgi:hypothetical protein
MAGDTLTLTCSISLPPGVNGTPVFNWEGPGETPTPANPTSSGRVICSELTLGVIAVSHAGLYKCIAILGGSINTNTTVTVLGMCLTNLLCT